MKKNVKKPLRQRLLNKYRLVVLNEETYEERISYKLTRLNIFLFVAMISTLLVITTITLIAFTSIKEYIPGYDSTLLRQKAVENIETLDSLEKHNPDQSKIYKLCWGGNTWRTFQKKTLLMNLILLK